MRVGFLWHSLASGNLGVGALSISNMVLVKKALDAEGENAAFVVFGPDGGGERISIPGIESVEYHALTVRSLFRPGLFKIAADLSACDVVFDIGSGDSFSDVYGYKRFFKVLFSKLLVSNSEKNLVLSPQTIGPFNKSLNDRLARFVLQRCRMVFTRDSASADYVASLTEGSVKPLIASDVALALPVAINASIRENQKACAIGVNISGLLFGGGYSEKNQFGLNLDYAQTMEALVALLSSIPDAEVWLISHVKSVRGLEIEDDQSAARKIAYSLGRANIKMAPDFSDPIHAKTFISSLDFFVGSRMHATIAAFSSGVPVIPLAYSRKFEGFFGSCGYDHVLDLRSCSQEEVLESVMSAFSQREAITRDVLQSRKSALEKLALYENAVRQLIHGRLASV